MKTNLHRLLSLCFLITVCLNATAQVGKKLPKKNSEDAMNGKVKPMITSPTAGSTVDGPFVLVGKAEPNTWVNIRVTPVYKLPKSTTGKPILVVSTANHKPQEFKAKADEKGVWQSQLIEVMFDSKTTDRRIFAAVNQTWDSYTYQSKNTEYLASPKLTLIMETIKVPVKPKEEEKSSGQPEKDEPLIKGGEEMAFKIAAPVNNKYVAHNRFTISGIAPDGASVKVEVRYWGYRSKSNITINNFGPIFYPGRDKTTTTVNDGVWATYTVRSKRLPGTGTTGLWATDEIEFIKKIDSYSCWANTYTITASLIDANGKSIRPIKVNVSRMKTVAIN